MITRLVETPLGTSTRMVYTMRSPMVRVGGGVFASDDPPAVLVIPVKGMAVIPTLAEAV